MTTSDELRAEALLKVGSKYDKLIAEADAIDARKTEVVHVSELSEDDICMLRDGTLIVFDGSNAQKVCGTGTLARRVIEDGEYPLCRICFDPIDYCQGHGTIGA